MIDFGFGASINATQMFVSCRSGGVLVSSTEEDDDDEVESRGRLRG